MRLKIVNLNLILPLLSWCGNDSCLILKTFFSFFLKNNVFVIQGSIKGNIKPLIIKKGIIVREAFINKRLI